MVNHELITLLTDEELDIDTALRGGCDRVEQRIIRHKVRAGDREPTLRGVDQRVEQSKVVSSGKPGPLGTSYGLGRKWRPSS